MKSIRDLVSGNWQLRSAVKSRLLMAAGAVALTSYTMAAISAEAPGAAAEETPDPLRTPTARLEEVLVTGTRIVRDGYQAPTPLTVVSTEEIESSSNSNVASFLNTMPVFQGSVTPQGNQSSVSPGTAGLNALNLRGLGTNRTLILLDGQRSVASTATGIVDINGIPQQLIQRVDVVTGGASAVYGSDAVGGVANFILDKTFTGFKSELSGGMTQYGDDENYKIALSGGFPFAGGRGHVLLSGEQNHNAGIENDGDRDWNEGGVAIMTNPANVAGAPGQPQWLVLDNVGISNATGGGLVVSGPLRGTAFGPGGVPYQLVYGDLVSDPRMRGGDWRVTDTQQEHGSNLDPKERLQNLFSRFSYDLTDNLNVFAQFSWNSSFTESPCCIRFNPGTAAAGANAIKLDNPFLPADVRARMIAAGVTTLTLGSMHYDLPRWSTETNRETNRNVLGASGTFAALGGDWNWSTYFQNGRSNATVWALNVQSNTRYNLAIDAVRHPVTGLIVCRSSIANPGNGCVPYNPMGTGVNNESVIRYLNGTGRESHQDLEITQNVWAASLTGEPFSLGGQPVSLAFSAEHRSEKLDSVADAGGNANDWSAGNYKTWNASTKVSEGAIEAVIPIVHGRGWSDAWDLNLAARYTDYETSGAVETWKVGMTYSPIRDVKLRITRSRDIRAPNLNELFAPNANLGIVNQLDPFAPAASQNVQVRTFTNSNPNLEPEEADTLGVGVVLQPSFAPGLGFAIDYWEIDLKDGVGNLGGGQALNLCFLGQAQYCGPQFFSRSTTAFYPGTTLGILQETYGQSVNIATQTLRGVDVEGSYQFGLGSGDLSLRASATYNIEDYSLSGIPGQIATDAVGAATPRWRLSGTVAYSIDPFRISFTGRAVDSGVLNNNFIECESSCPQSTTDYRTINDNSRPGSFFLDGSMSYKVRWGEGIEGDVFLNVRNILNRDPPIVPQGPAGQPWFTFQATGPDSFGRTFRAGVRIRM